MGSPFREDSRSTSQETGHPIRRRKPVEIDAQPAPDRAVALTARRERPHGRCRDERAIRSRPRVAPGLLRQRRHEPSRCASSRRSSRSWSRRSRAAAQPSPAPPATPAPTTDIFDVWRAFRHKDDGGRAGGLGLSQGDEGVRAGHRRQAVERRAARRRRQHRVLSRRSGDDAHLLGGREPDVLDARARRDHRSLHDVRRATIAGGWKPITAFSGPRSRPTPLGTSADTSDGVLADFDFFRLHHTAYYQLRPGLYAGAGLYFDNHINIGPRDDDERRAGRVGGVALRRIQRARTAFRSTRRRRWGRASICCGTRATASSTPRAAGWPRPATARRSTASSAPTRAGSA